MSYESHLNETHGQPLPKLLNRGVNPTLDIRLTYLKHYTLTKINFQKSLL
jgi:hypothetical protein